MLQLERSHLWALLCAGGMVAATGCDVTVDQAVGESHLTDPDADNEGDATETGYDAYSAAATQVTCRLDRLAGVDGDGPGVVTATTGFEEDAEGYSEWIDAFGEQYSFAMAVWEDSLQVIFNDSDDEAGSFECEIPTDRTARGPFCVDVIEVERYVEETDEYVTSKSFLLRCQLDLEVSKFRAHFAAVSEDATFFSAEQHQPVFISGALGDLEGQPIDADMILATLGEEVSAFYAQQGVELPVSAMATEDLTGPGSGIWPQHLSRYDTHDADAVIASAKAWERIFGVMDTHAYGHRAMLIGAAAQAGEGISADVRLRTLVVVGKTADGHLAGFLVGITRH